MAQSEEQFGASSAKVAEYEVVIGALRSSQSKLQSENGELSTQLSDAESKNGSLSKANNNLSAQLDEAKSELETEIAVSCQMCLYNKYADFARPVIFSYRIFKTRQNIYLRFFFLQGKLEFQSKLKSAQADLAQLQDSLDEEQEAKNALQKQLAAAKSDANMWRNKYEGEATQRMEELEDAK